MANRCLLAVASICALVLFHGNVSAEDGEQKWEFSTYAVSARKPGRVVFPNFGGRDKWARDHRTRIRDAMKQGPNFAGHYAMVEIGCGTSCRFGYVADLDSGRVIAFPFGGEEFYQLALIYESRSRLMLVKWMAGDFKNCIERYVIFDDEQFKRLAEMTEPAVDGYCN
jgi:hypothetical protein